ncbi:MAG TPA: lipase maturation factor family protein [Acidimicrobiales bacterium]|nr:lipase maturation factor family protein [Acidimicrobiales bacterium]
MDWLQAPDYWLARLVFERLLGGVYLVAFLVAANQFRPLLGERGLLPAPRFLASVGFARAPSILHLHYSDRFLSVVAWSGAAVAALCAAGVPQAGPWWAAAAAWAALWALYLSIVNVGQRFYGFGWESLLLEAGFLAIFLGPADWAPPTLLVVALRWLLFRLEFGAGVIKMRGDPCWRDLTCLRYHHETQPLPNPLSWWFHHLPRPVHRLEVAGNHAAQLVAPFLLFAPQPVAAVAGAAVVVTQVWLVLSGNFAWLNLLTIALAAAAFDNDVLAPLLPVEVPATTPSPPWHQALVAGIALLVAVLSRRPIVNLASPRQVMNSSFDPLHLVNTYGAFGSVTRQRFEVVIEGTDAAEPGAGAVWREYELKGKPGDPLRRPRQVAPYHLRLDWVLWFVALPGRRFDHPWVSALLTRLLENDGPTLRLFRTNPFPGEPPAFVRARLYHYRFTTPAERRATGAWWVRTPAGELRPALGRPSSAATR